MKLAYDLTIPPGDREENLPPIILLHGMLDSKKTWKYIAPKIAKSTGRRVYSLDARNHGDSPRDSVFNFDILAEDLNEFLDNHHIPHATIVGHSMGGRTAMTLALKRPEKVEKLIVEDMNSRNFSPKSSGMIVHLVSLLKESLSAIPPGADDMTARLSIAKFMSPLLSSTQTSAWKNFDLDMMPLGRCGRSYEWQANLDVIEDMLTTDKVRQKLSGVFMGDSLFLYGTKSFFAVEHDKTIPKLFPRATFIGVEGAGHIIHHERTGDFLQAVCEFINNHVALKSKY